MFYKIKQMELYRIQDVILNLQTNMTNVGNVLVYIKWEQNVLF